MYLSLVYLVASHDFYDLLCSRHLMQWEIAVMHAVYVDALPPIVLTLVLLFCSSCED